jgi:hypothetical protein
MDHDEDANQIDQQEREELPGSVIEVANPVHTLVQARIATVRPKARAEVY